MTHLLPAGLTGLMTHMPRDRPDDSPVLVIHSLLTHVHGLVLMSPSPLPETARATQTLNNSGDSSPPHPYRRPPPRGPPHAQASSKATAAATPAPASSSAQRGGRRAPGTLSAASATPGRAPPRRGPARWRVQRLPRAPPPSVSAARLPSQHVSLNPGAPPPQWGCPAAWHRPQPAGPHEPTRAGPRTAASGEQ